MRINFKGIHLTMGTIVIIILLLITLVVILTFFLRGFEETREPIHDVSEATRDFSDIVNPRKIMRSLGLCTPLPGREIEWRCVKPRPLDDEDCSDGDCPDCPGPFDTEADCVMANCSSGDPSPLTDKRCFCKCFDV